MRCFDSLFIPRVHILSLGLVAFTGSVVTSTPALASSDNPDVKGGEPVTSCQWPTTVGLKGVCTGTLIHPQVVLYAAHCNFNQGSTTPDALPTKADFGDSIKAGAIEKSIPFKFCKVHPDYYHPDGVNNHGFDVAFCVLQEAVTDMPIAPVIQGCERDALVPGTSKVFLAGFGYHADPGSAEVDDEKYWVETPLVDFLYDDQELKIGDTNTGTCAGDSGGSVFARIEDGTWRHVGIVSYGDGQTACSNPYSYVTYSETALEFVEGELQKAGETTIDLTPCFDGDIWKPTQECGHYALELDQAHGAWDDMCSQDAPKSGYSASCGPAFGDDDDDDTTTGEDSSTTSDETSSESDETTPSDDDDDDDDDGDDNDDTSSSNTTESTESTASGKGDDDDDDDDDAGDDDDDDSGDDDDDSGEESASGGCSLHATHPAAWMLAGFGLVGAIARRRTRT